MKKLISIPPNYFYGCILLCVPFYFFDAPIKFLSFPYNISGVVLIILGLYLVINPWFLFKKHDTPEDFSDTTALVCEGIFKYTRNPMYLGGVNSLLGLSVTTGNMLSFVTPLIFFMCMHYMFIPYEEQELEKKFGNEYMKYKHSVRRWI